MLAPMNTTGGARPVELDVGALFDVHAPFLLRLIERLTGPGPHVEDLLQEAFLVAHRHLGAHSLEPYAARAWLSRTAVNAVRHHRRSFARRKRLETSLAQRSPSRTSAAPDERYLEIERAHRVRACVGSLPLKQREVFVLYELEEMSGKDIAAALSVPENTVWTRLHHARARFKRLWLAAEGSTP
jgi:RNA polymerase sigma-70 factor (ECF subfamily)